MTRDRLTAQVAPAYLLLCLLAGGSAQGIWPVALLQVLAVLIIAWSFVRHVETPTPPQARTLAWLLLALLFLIVMQMVPLPPALWTALPGRDLVLDGRSILGLPPGWSSISLAPYDTAATMLSLLPPIAILCAMVRRKAYTATGLAIAIVVGTAAGIVLGALQTTSTDPMNSPWYPYRISNFGVATGFFANGNHMASLLLVSVPFTAALAAHAGEANQEARKRRAVLAIAAAALAVVMVGIALNGSLTGYGLLIPVLLASLSLAVPLGKRLRSSAMGLCLAGLLAFLVLVFSPLGDRLPNSDAATSVGTRQTMLATGAEAFEQFAPVGSGLGTFPKVYPLFENPDTVQRTYTNHAHNDYLELAIELGVPGILLAILFLAWWTSSIRSMLASPARDAFASAGAIGSAAILVHSFVDYPLRTSAMSAVFAVCIALIILSRRTVSSATDIRPTRHLVIG